MDLNTLKAALKPLTQFAQDELSFVIPMEGSEVEVTLRPLLPKEEIACQQFSAGILAASQEEEGTEDDDALTRASALQYFDHFRTGVISYALVQIGTTDLRKEKYIETGKVLSGGAKERVERHVALRDIISESWSRAMITICFSKYGDLITTLSEKADKIASESVQDLDAEIERMERRVLSLKQEREKRAHGDPSVTAQQIRSLVNAGKALEGEVDNAIDQVRKDTLRQEAIKAAEAQEAAEREEAGSAPPEPPAATPTPKPAPRRPVTPRRVPPPTAPVTPPEFRSSFEEPDHPDSEGAQLDRLRAAQNAAAEASRSVLEGEEDPRGAVSRAVEVGAMRGPDGKLMRGPDGEPVRAFKLPAETISARGRGPGQRPKMDQAAQGTINPNFKPSGG